MPTIPSRDVQARFGAVLDIAKREPVTVTQYGRPSVMIIDYETAMEGQRLLAAKRLADFLRNRTASPEAEALSEEDINRMVHELRP